MEHSSAVRRLSILCIDAVYQMIEQDRVLREDRPAVRGAIADGQVQFLLVVQGALAVEALTLMVVNDAK